MKTVGSDRAETGSAWAQPVVDLLTLVAIGSVAGVVVTRLHFTDGQGWLDDATRVAGKLHDQLWLNRLMLDITHLGGEALLIVVSLLVVAWTYRATGILWARFFGLVATGGLVLDNLIKPIVGRARPNMDQLVGGRGPSFPSGHVTAVTALLLAFAYFISIRWPSTPKWIWSIAIGGSILMATSRVYLGVHWPTDTLAGMVLGGSWVWMCIRSQKVPRPSTLVGAEGRSAPGGLATETA